VTVQVWECLSIQVTPDTPIAACAEFFKPEKGRYLHPTEHRALTHHEAALLQGFPSTHKWVGSKIAIARQIGNAVPLQLAQAIAGQLRQACE
jgi:DNA (cytosine-5)-methyltransferase 1